MLASVADYLKTATTNYTSGSGVGITINADDVTIQNLTVRSYQTGIQLGTSENTLLDDVTINGTVNGIRKGTGAAVTDLDILGGLIEDSYIGMYISKETADGLDLNDVLINGTAFYTWWRRGSISRRSPTR